MQQSAAFVVCHRSVLFRMQCRRAHSTTWHKCNMKDNARKASSDEMASGSQSLQISHSVNQSNRDGSATCRTLFLAVPTFRDHQLCGLEDRRKMNKHQHICIRLVATVEPVGNQLLTWSQPARHLLGQNRAPPLPDFYA